MENREQRNDLGQFGYQPRKEERGYQPSGTGSKSNDKLSLPPKDGNVAQKK